MTDTALRTPPSYEPTQSVFDLVALPANHVLVSDRGVRFSSANVPVHAEVVAAAKRLCAALTQHAVPGARAKALEEAGRCIEQMRVLGRLSASISDAKTRYPQGAEALASVSDALSEFLKVWSQGSDAGEAQTCDADGPWHHAVLSACIVRESCYVPDDPEKTVRQLLQRASDCAADPGVSERAAALAPPRRSEQYYMRAIDCPHTIESERIVLRRDPKRPGSNALAQLADRLSVPPGALPDDRFWMSVDPDLEGLSPAEVLHGTAFPARAGTDERQRLTLAQSPQKRVALVSAVAERRRRVHFTRSHVATPNATARRPPTSLPTPATVWEHAGGAEYTVVGTTSEPDDSKAEKHPQLVIYAGPDGRVWARTLERFLARFKEVRGVHPALPNVPVHMSVAPLVWLAALQQALKGERGLVEVWKARATDWERAANTEGEGTASGQVNSGGAPDAPSAVAHEDTAQIGTAQIGNAIVGAARELEPRHLTAQPRAVELTPAQTGDSVSGAPACHCHRCLAGVVEPAALVPVTFTRMIVCPQCGYRRCPHASDHDLDCTGSNEPGQPGSVHK